MNCEDCKGTGVYRGLEKLETCLRCNGSRLEPKLSLLESLQSIGKSAREEMSTWPDWKQKLPPVRYSTQPADSFFKPGLPQAIRSADPKDIPTLQLRWLHSRTNGQLVDAFSALIEPLPQVVFEVPWSLDTPWVGHDPRLLPRMWWKDLSLNVWRTLIFGKLCGTCATPGPQPKPGSSLLCLNSKEDVEALISRYKNET